MKAAVKVVGCHHGSPTHRNESPGRGQVVFNGLAREMKSSVNLKTSCRPDSSRTETLPSLFRYGVRRLFAQRLEQPTKSIRCRVGGNRRGKRIDCSSERTSPRFQSSREW
jgi:hypothetical protein